MNTGSHGTFDSDTLLYTTGSSGWQRIRYQQIAFVEAQRGDGHAFEAEGASFFAATAKDSSARAWAQRWRLGGKLVRLWQFNDPHFTTDPPPSFPATDHPDSNWYKERTVDLRTALPSPGSARAVATLKDRGGPPYPLRLYLERRGTRWVVTRIGDA